MPDTQPPRDRFQFTLRDLFVALTVLGVAFALLAPLVNQAREAARRNQCTSRWMQLGLALHNYHDIYKRIPAVSTLDNHLTARPGDASATSAQAGYSWRVLILPYIEEQVVYAAARRASGDFALANGIAWHVNAAFSNNITRDGTAQSAANPHLSTHEHYLQHCPSYRGPTLTTASGSFPGVGEDGYRTIGCPVSNYAVLAATHLACMEANPAAPDAEPPNGIITPGTGRNFRDCTDGLSRTLLGCETREPLFSAWFDGSVNWVVGTAPLNSTGSAATSQQPVRNSEGNWSSATGPAGTSSTALNLGPGRSPAMTYLPQGVNVIGKGKERWTWGPSSDHPGGVVMHLFGDGGVRSITEEIDATIYMQLISRSGGEACVIPGSP